MSLDSYNNEVSRKVWENKNGAKVMSVSGILDKGEYNLTVSRETDGKVVIECKPI